MTQNIEDYAMIGDTETAALVGRDGSIDWLCLPASTPEVASPSSSEKRSTAGGRSPPDQPVTSHVRRYRSRSMVLETEITTDTGVVRVIDFMPPRHHHPRVVRLVQGVEGDVCRCAPS